MPHIVLTDDQMQVIDHASEAVEVRRTDGRVVSRIEPTLSAAEIAEIKRRLATGVFYSGEQVQAYLKLLEQEVAERGACDEVRAKELLTQLTPVR